MFCALLRWSYGRKSLCALAGVAGALLLGGAQAASGAQVTAAITGVQYATSGYTTVNLTLNGHNWGNVIAGPEQWHETSGDVHLGDASGHFITFCIEILQDVVLKQPIPNSYTYTLDSLANAPKPGDQVRGPVSAGSMDTIKAQDIETLWALDYAQVHDGASAAAFQLAIWEIVYENNGKKWNVLASNTSDRGDLFFAASAVANQAQGFLDALSTRLTTGGGPIHSNLVALTSATAQDQITIAPLPASVWGGVVLLGGMLVVSRFRKSAQLAA